MTSWSQSLTKDKDSASLILQSTELRSVLFAGHRPGGIKVGIDCSEIAQYRVPGVQVRCLVERIKNRLTCCALRATGAMTGARRGNSRR